LQIIAASRRINIESQVLNITLAGIFELCHNNENVALIAFLCNGWREFAAEGKALGAAQTMGFQHKVISRSSLCMARLSKTSDFTVYQEYYALEGKL
jgi:hypothetical protein